MDDGATGRAVRLAMIGWGAIGSRVGALLAARQAPVELVGVAVRDAGRLPPGLPLLGGPEGLRAARPDLVVEAAGRDAVAAWGPAALACGARALVLASTSALVDDALLAQLAETAERHGSRVVLPAGAIGAVDALRAASVLGLDRVEHTVRKPPAAWRGTEAEALVDLDALTGPAVFYEGTAREAARRYPQNANATAVTALAGIGLDRTAVRLVADPHAALNGHEITAEGPFGRLRVSLENAPLATNPKSSELTALSLVRLIENEALPVAI